MARSGEREGQREEEGGEGSGNENEHLLRPRLISLWVGRCSASVFRGEGGGWCAGVFRISVLFSLMGRGWKVGARGPARGRERGGASAGGAEGRRKGV